jgi:hypothetical protein
MRIPHELELEPGDVHHHRRIAEPARDPAPALEVQLDLADPLLDGDVQLGERPVAHDAVRFDAV